MVFWTFIIVAAVIVGILNLIFGLRAKDAKKRRNKLLSAALAAVIAAASIPDLLEAMRPPSEAERMMLEIERKMAEADKTLRETYKMLKDGGLDVEWEESDPKRKLTPAEEEFMSAVIFANIGRQRELLSEAPKLAQTRGQDGYTPLHKVADRSSDEEAVEMARLLLQNGAEVNARNRFNATPLHLAASQGRAKLCALLIDKGADLNAKANTGRTPLHCAAGDGRLEACQVLLARGADPDIRDGVEMTPLELAEHEKNEEVADLLRDYMASPKQ